MDICLTIEKAKGNWWEIVHFVGEHKLLNHKTCHYLLIPWKMFSRFSLQNDIFLFLCYILETEQQLICMQCYIFTELWILLIISICTHLPNIETNPQNVYNEYNHNTISYVTSWNKIFSKTWLLKIVTPLDKIVHK